MIIEFIDDFDNCLLIDIDGTLNCMTSFDRRHVEPDRDACYVWVIEIKTEHVEYDMYFKTKERRLEIYNKIKRLVKWGKLDDFIKSMEESDKAAESATVIDELDSEPEPRGL